VSKSSPASTATEARKAAIREVLARVAAVAEGAGLVSAARDIRGVRMPKLDEERLSIVVLGEFNHGKSTFINALLEDPLLPVGITPTTAVLVKIAHGPAVTAEAMFESGERRKIERGDLAEWLTVDGKREGEARAPRDARAGSAVSATGAATLAPLDHVQITHPGRFLAERVTLVDTPGVNDINEQRAEITYGYLPRADTIFFLLDATQILSASEVHFLQERILRTSRDRLIFVVTKADLLDAAELEQAMAFARTRLAAIVPAPTLFAVSAKRALQGQRQGRPDDQPDPSGMAPLLAHLEQTLGTERRRLVFDHALADAARLGAFVRQSLGMRRRSLELPMDVLGERVARAQKRLEEGRGALDAAARVLAADSAGLKARVRQDLAAFADGLASGLPRDIDEVPAADVQRFLGPFLQDTWKSWLEAESDVIARELEQVAERVIEVANERAEGVTREVLDELGGPEARLDLAVDTFRYDASVFALGALGTTVFLFVNTLAGGLIALAAPMVAVLLKGRAAQEMKEEAKRRAPEAVRAVAATLAPKLDQVIDDFSARLKDFIADAGSALGRGIAEVLDRALAERQRLTDATSASSEGMAIDRALGGLRAIDEAIAEIRQSVWSEG
jgi:GTP-binding protein EngB required for normal cell division